MLKISVKTFKFYGSLKFLRIKDEYEINIPVFVLLLASSVSSLLDFPELSDRRDVISKDNIFCFNMSEKRAINLA